MEHFFNLPSLIPGLPTAMVGARRWLIPMAKRQSIEGDQIPMGHLHLLINPATFNGVVFFLQIG